MEMMIIKCKHYPDKECTSRVINDKACNQCMFEMQGQTIKDQEEKIDLLTARLEDLENKKPVKKTGRATKAKMIG